MSGQRRRESCGSRQEKAEDANVRCARLSPSLSLTHSPGQRPIRRRRRRCRLVPVTASDRLRPRSAPRNIDFLVVELTF